MPTAPVLLRRTSGPARVPLLGLGSHGGDVQKLQALLNLRLSPSPALRVDGRFGPRTATALRHLQHSAAIGVDGIAGKDTWRVLGTGKMYAGAPVAPPSAPAVVAAASAAAAAAPVAADAVASSSAVLIDDVLSWTAERKFSEVARRAVQQMPGHARDELLGMISLEAIGVSLTIWAASHLVGAGAVIDIAVGGIALVQVGLGVFDLMQEFGNCLVLTHTAANQQELDKAAGMLSVVMTALAIAVLAALLKKFGPKGGGAAKPEAKAKAKSTTSPNASGQPKRVDVSRQTPAPEPIPQRSTKTADKASSTCAQHACPISMVSGEEMLALEDFRWEGPVPLVWRRFYRSGFSDRDGALGHGWLTPLDQWLEVGERVTYHNADGQRIDLPLPVLNGNSSNVPEGLRLFRDRDGFRLRAAHGPDLCFDGLSGRCMLARWQDRAGPAITVERDAAGQVQALAASWGRHLLIEREHGRIVAIVPARRGAAGLESTGKPLVRYDYDAQGDLVAAHDRLGQGERYAYRGHLLSRRTLAGGFEVDFEWDAAGPRARCLRSRGSDGIYDYRFEWLPGGVSRAVDARGGRFEYEHNAQSQLLRQRSPEGRETWYAYDARNLLRSITDPAGQVTRFEHDADGRLVRVTDADDHAHRIDYDNDGNPVAWTDPLQARWLCRYDALGRPLELRDASGATTRYEYNGQGLLGAVVDALGRRRTLLWDEQLRLVADIGFDAVRRRYQYDADDRIVATTVQDRLVHRQDYDAVGRVMALHGPDGRSTRMRYDAAGRLTHFTDAAGQTTEYRYDHGLSQPSARVDPLGQVTHYEYDRERNLTALVNPKGERCALAYDLDENLVEETGFDGRVQRYVYGAAGHLAAHLQRAGDAWRETRFVRDAGGRLLRKLGFDGSAAHFEHDAAGRLIAATNAEGRLAFERDPMGRVLRETHGDSVVRMAYDALGRRSQLVTPQGLRIGYQHNEQGRLAGVTLDGAPLSAHRYDDLGREIARTQGELESAFEHDAMGRLLRHRAAKPGGGPVLGRRYAYDAAGRLGSSEDWRGGLSHYLYDPADRLLEVQGLGPERFVHDPAGNLLGDTAQGGHVAQAGLVEGNRLTLWGDRHMRYDEAGNLVEVRRGTGGRLVTRYAYDSDNRLQRVDMPDGVVEFAYDALGRRTRKRSAAGETRFVYCGLNLLAEASGTQTRTWVFEPESFRPLALIDDKAEIAADVSTRRISHYHLDQLGTPREMTDVSGRVVWSARCRAYGALALAEVEEVVNPLRFQGQYHDVETGLHYNLNRYYDPQTGRFVNQDPIGLVGGENAYRYAPNPVNWVDPLGWMAKAGDCGPSSEPGDARKVWTATEDGIVLPPGKTIDVVPTKPPDPRAPQWRQLHSSHPHNGDPRAHAHGPEPNTGKRVDAPLDKTMREVDQGLRDGTLRERTSRSDKGGI